jgi:hypothetical protein
MGALFLFGDAMIDRPPHSIDPPPPAYQSEMAQVLGVVRTILQHQAEAAKAAADRESRREAREDRREERQATLSHRMEQKIDDLSTKVDALEADNLRQDRVQAHDGSIAEEALASAAEAAARAVSAENKAEASAAGRRAGAVWGFFAALATALAAVLAAWLQARS